MQLRAGSPGEVGMLPERVALARDLCAKWVKEGHTTALCVCVARRGVIVLHEAFGRLRPEQDAPPLERDSIFPLSSATKPITATLVMQLVEDGLVGLNRPVRDYLPEIAGEGTDDMLVHHLLTHTSGYPWHTDAPVLIHAAKKLEAGFEPPPCPPTQHPTLHEQYHLLCDLPLVERPGELMVYSNHNYELLGELVRRVSGRALEDLARERIFGPLGMDDTWYVLPEAADARVVKRPPDAPLAAPMGPHFQGFNSRAVQEIPYGGLGCFSTARDLASFDQAFLSGGRQGDARILSPPAVAAMTRNQIPGTRAKLFEFTMPEASWGYGWTVESYVKWPYYNGSLWPLGAYSHAGMGGIMHWVDPAHEIVGAYCEVTLRISDKLALLWKADLFQNAITSAIA